MENGARKVFIENKEIYWETIAPGVRRKIMAWDERLMLVRVAFEEGATGALHNHPHSQITHVESGIFEVEIDGSKKVLTTGDAFYAPPHIMHGVVCLAEGVLVDLFSPMREDFIKVEGD